MKLRVAVLGVLARHKGLPLVIEVAHLIRRRRLPIELQLIGYVPRFEHDEALPFATTGPYEAHDLSRLIADNAVDVVWFPVRWPETFSYTLSSAMETSAQLLVPAIGALPERVAERAGTIVYPWDSSAAEIVGHLERILRAPHRAVPARSGDAEGTAFYPRTYLHPPERLRGRPTDIVTYETTHATGQYDACAYIRVRLPYRHAAAGRYWVRSLRQGELPSAARMVVVQRTAIASETFARRLVSRCTELGAKLVYETDDDLFGIPPEHPEYQSYRERTAGARVILEAAHAVTTSTAALAERLRPLHPNVRVIPNLLDERLWFEEPLQTTERPPHAQEIRAVYMGTATHQDDLALVKEAIERAQRRNPRFVLEVVGGAPAPEPWYRHVPVPSNVGASYPAFVRWFRSQTPRWSFAIAPLRATDFNAGKSVMKFLDYGAVGLTAIFSDVAPFDALARRAAPVVLVPNETTRWTDAILTLAHDERRRKTLGDEARVVVRERFTLGARGSELRSFVDELLVELQPQAEILSING